MAKKELNKKTSELLITVAADKKVWKEEQTKAENALIKDVEIKGFRKGHVPLDIAKKHISTQKIFEKSITKMLDILVKEAAKEIDKDTFILDSPTYKVEKISDVELEITFIYPIYPEIKLPNYKEMNVKYETPKFDKKQVENEIKRIQDMQSTLENKEEAIEKGDTAVFDYVGKVDGEEFDGGKAEKHSLEIGSGQFIPGFEDQMIGLKSGEQKDIKVTFPKEYHAENLKGKEAIFEIKVHEVKVKKSPKVDDEFVKSIGVKNVSTVEELNKYLENLFKQQGEQQARSKFQKEIFEKILKETNIALPSQLIAKEMQNQKNRFEEQIKQQGLTFEKYVQMTGVKEEVLNSQFKDAAENRLKESLIFAEIAKQEKIELSDEDYEKEYKKLAKVYQQDEKSIKSLINKQQMQIPMTNDKVIDILINSNK